MKEEYAKLHNEFTRSKNEHDEARAVVVSEMDQATQRMELAFNDQMPSWSRYERALKTFKTAESAMQQFLSQNPSVLALLPKELPESND